MIIANNSMPKFSVNFVLRPFNPPRGVLGPFGPKVGNGVENEFLGPSGPGAQKVKNSRKRVKEWKFHLFFNFFDSFLTLFLTFWTPGPAPEAPGSSFSTPFPTLGPKGPRIPLGGLKGGKFRPQKNPRLNVSGGDHGHKLRLAKSYFSWRWPHTCAIKMREQ